MGAVRVGSTLSNNYCMHSNVFLTPLETIVRYNIIYSIQKNHHLMLISRGCPWEPMKRGGCKFGGSKTGAVLCPKRGAVVSQLVLKLKESVPPPPPPGVSLYHRESKRKGMNW